MTLPAAGVQAKVEIAFVTNPFANTLTWTDVTDRCVKFQTVAGRNYETDHNEASTVTMTLRNKDGALDPLNTASPYYPFVLPFRPIRITALVGSTWWPVWYGYVQTWPQKWGDASTQYGYVEITGVDAMKTILAFVPGAPYDTRVKSDYNVNPVPSGYLLGAADWQFWCFDEAAPPFAGENPVATLGNLMPLICLGSTPAPAKSSISPCRTSLVFNGSNVLGTSGLTYQANTQAGDLWFQPTSLPTTPGKAQLVWASDWATGDAMAYQGLPAGKYLAAGNRDTGAGVANAVALVAPYPNLMPTDNSASFETDVSEWASENSNATIAQSTAQAAVGNAAMRVTFPYQGTNAPLLVSMNGRIPVTAGWQYAMSACISVDSSSTFNGLQLQARFYNSGGTLLSTASPTMLYTAALIPGGFIYIAGGPFTAPAGATAMQVAVYNNTPSHTGTGSYWLDVDAVSVITDSGTGVIPNTGGQSYIAPSAGAPGLKLIVQTLHSIGSSPTTFDIYETPAPAANTWHHIAWTPYVLSPTGAGAWLDGNTFATHYTGTATVFHSGQGDYVFVGGGWSYGAPPATAQYGFIGNIAAVWATGGTTPVILPTQPYALEHYNYGTNGAGQAVTHDFPQQLTSARVAAILNSVGYPTGMQNLETGLTTMVASGDVTGVTATTLLEQAADTELGNVFCDQQGRVTFHNRNHRNSATVKAVFGENTAGGEIPVESSVEIDFDDTYIYNDTQITQDKANPAFMFESQDKPSQLTYGIRTLQATIQAVNQSDVVGMAQSLLARYKDPHPRAVVVDVECRSKPQFFPAVFALNIGDLVTLNRRPITGAPQSTLNAFVDGIQHTVDESSWTVEFNTTPQYPNTTY